MWCLSFRAGGLALETEGVGFRGGGVGVCGLLAETLGAAGQLRQALIRRQAARQGSWNRGEGLKLVFERPGLRDHNLLRGPRLGAAGTAGGEG